MKVSDSGKEVRWHTVIHARNKDVDGQVSNRQVIDHRTQFRQFWPLLAKGAARTREHNSVLIARLNAQRIGCNYTITLRRSVQWFDARSWYKAACPLYVNATLHRDVIRGNAKHLPILHALQLIARAQQNCKENGFSRLGTDSVREREAAHSHCYVAQFPARFAARKKSSIRETRTQRGWVGLGSRVEIDRLNLTHSTNAQNVHAVRSPCELCGT